ncbi:MAG: 4-hydroxy-3-methylbut-2-enyl diphosphate reductase [Desulfamplus sp.]|nr:4-hydroxy-3-methylbut-2-enyl diphosphate reductase [Desulfamplus sp.]
MKLKLTLVMKITIAKTAGFCMGVRRAVDMVLDAANKTSDPICTYGPLIHNPQVLNMLEEKGIPVMHHIPEKGEGTVLIRAHGVPPDEHKSLEDAGFTVINATCPKVIRVQTIIRKHANKGFATIIIGDKDHPEVKGLMGYSKRIGKLKINRESEETEINKTSDEVKFSREYEDSETNRGYTVSTIEELSKLPTFEKAIVVAQTTQDTALYDSIKDWVLKNCPHYKVFDTICDSTEKRQAETREIAQKSDAVIVVGGKDSGNTRRLAQIAFETLSNRQYSSTTHQSNSQTTTYNLNKTDYLNSEMCKKTTPLALHIEDVSELDMAALSQAQSIAITAGASTPNWIIKKSCRAIEEALKKDEPSPKAYLLSVRDFILKSNLLLAIGAGSLTYACSELQEIDHNLIHASISMLYVLSMQILNNLFSIKSDRYNNPERAEFYESNKKILAFIAILSGAGGLFLSFTTGVLPFVILSFMSILGLLYNQKIFPDSDSFPKIHFLGRRITRIKDVPGSKTILIAAAWGTVTSILPALSNSNNGKTVLLVCILFIIPFIFATSILFARTSFFAILEMQGDRITGKETIPIILGEKKSQKIIQNILLFASTTLFLSALSGLISTSAILIATIPLSMLYFIKLHEKGKIDHSMQLEFIIESHFILAGIITIFC